MVMGALVLGGLLIGGCSAQPGVAASVDNTVHTQSDLISLVDELSPFLAQGNDASVLLANLIMAEPFLDHAARFNVGVGKQEAEEFLNQLSEDSGLETPDEWADSTLSVTRLLLLQDHANSKGVWQEVALGASEDLETADIDINPRYGTWEGGMIVPSASDWIITVP